MKIPDMFIPEHKSLEQKTEQLLEKPKLTGQEVSRREEKEIALESILKEFNGPPSVRSNDLRNKIGYALKLEGYSEFQTSKISLLGLYWIKKESSAGQEWTNVFFRRAFGSFDKKEYGFAKVKEINLEEFCTRLERRTIEEQRKNLFYHYSLSTSVKGGIVGSAALGSLMSIGLFGFGHPVSLYNLSLITAASLVGFLLGSILFDNYAHKRNENKMLKLCSYFTDDEKEAIRMALE